MAEPVPTTNTNQIAAGPPSILRTNEKEQKQLDHADSKESSETIFEESPELSEKVRGIIRKQEGVSERAKGQKGDGGFEDGPLREHW